ncbi:protein of unknown function [Methanoculleus bourgensis]|uniref:Uncharacterized protein n=1 Tax=Methanoculleus bourgensis TaxID=83986 RepID=A0A0X3BRX0_9EURY|nr:protein of unknown function [Methanoculleus bourgensis]
MARMGPRPLPTGGSRIEDAMELTIWNLKLPKGCLFLRNTPVVERDRLNHPSSMREYMAFLFLL